jgi:flagellar L-ring protein precursor FlgH
MNRLISIVFMALFTGCEGLPNQHQFTPVAPQLLASKMGPEQPSREVAGSIYQEGRHMRLFEDRTARRVGDILTIRLVERTDASKKASTNVDKKSETDIPSFALLGNSVELETNLKGDRQFDGAGKSDQSNSLKGQVSAIVVDIYPNGNLMIRGEKMLTLNQGQEFVQISGMVRPDDIAADNSILSTQVADAQITYAGKGAMADANAAGWLSRFFLSPYWPF